MQIQTKNLIRNLSILFAFFVVFVSLAYGLEMQKDNPGKTEQKTDKTPIFRLSLRLFQPTATPTMQPTPTEVEIPTPVPTTFVPPLSIVVPPPCGAGGVGGPCGIPLEVVVFVDYNRDGVGVTGEMITGLQIHLYDSSYNRMGTAYTVDGRASFCLPRKGVYYLDMPYIQTTKEFRNDSISNVNLITVALDPPDIPIRLP